MRLLADENLHNDIVRALRRERPDIRLVTIQELGLTGVGDPELLSVAADNDLVVISHDVQTLVGFAYERVSNGRRMPGLLIVSTPFHVGQVVDDILLIVDAALDRELDDQVRFLPL